MTSHIDDTPSEPRSSFKERYQEVKPLTDTDKLIIELERQLKHVESKGKPGGMHEQKANVIRAAIDMLNGNGSLDDLRNTITENPRYNEATFRSTTESLVNRAITMQQDIESGMKPK
ncbi:hypothetical protein [Legionella erythra]|uniref:Uncharacterized protein n=1 Tax=Legionella erythra TaxID=448 RepID=A0A0W0TKJ3_LEGER|nr:hypothetical protein [Legionella erythra]KTC96072.1 hypothetical protein Lery_1864 [Legionella erythra]